MQPRPFTPYQPRPLSFLGVREVKGYRLKVYSIVYGERPFRADPFEQGLAVAAAELPQPSVTAGRPGVGFVIEHQGRTGDYLILSWWDQENELPTRVFVSAPAGWRPATGGESFCVWDLRVVWSEREAYVSTMLSGRSGGVEAYLSSVAASYA